METETPSFANEQLDSSVGGVAGGVAAAGGSTSNDNRGKHRILAELKRLEQELKSLEGDWTGFRMKRPGDVPLCWVFWHRKSWKSLKEPKMSHQYVLNCCPI
ncbi:uncharacterized protein LOC107425920 isoform X2 [Ziziphus jujuba]|uniref:Uncharacterized protein LOC107425920 isoform X2 n=1 Tax=Ziziphus jujuba TaxID=326968 RepID=A0ABM3ZSG0_ZIZJJ|nr:uncharacterized protein LOC107425920 isoform X2 [Ziziphus jujuba]